MAHGHATHFLERLERTSPAETELALSLYRDPILVGFLLRALRISEDTERIAISLDPADEGPFVVVNGSGVFVTCLARGMRPDPLPVVTFGQLQHHRAKSEQFAKRLEQAKAMSSTGDPLEMIQQMASKGHVISREQFIAAAALQPVLKHELLLLLAKTFASFELRRGELAGVRRATKKLRPELRALWNDYQLMGHLLLLALMDGRTDLDEGVETELYGILDSLFELGTLHMGARTLWTIGRIGKPFFDRVKTSCATPRSASEYFMGVAALGILGLRHRKLRRPAMKALGTGTTLSSTLATRVQALGLDPRVQVAKLMESPEAADDPYLADLRSIAFEEIKSVRTPPEFTFDGPHDVPDDLAVAWTSLWPEDITTNEEGDGPGWLLAVLPHLAGSQAEQFYLPQELLDALQLRWAPGLSLALLRGAEPIFLKTSPTQSSGSKPGRNEPCPCGSGKKYKRCHGA